MSPPPGVEAPQTRPKVQRYWHPEAARLRVQAPVAVLFAFLALAFLIPTRLVFTPLGAAGRPVVIAGVALLLLWFLVVGHRGGLPAGMQPIRWVVLGYLLTQAAGYAAGYRRGLPYLEANSADRWMITTAAMAGVVFCFADGPRSRRQLNLLLYSLLGFGVFAAVVGALQSFVGLDLQQYVSIPGLQPIRSLLEVTERGYGVTRVSGFAQHYIEFGVVLAALVPLAVHVVLYARSSNTRLIAWTSLAAITAAVPLSVSRSGILTLLVGILSLSAVWSWRLRYNALVIGLVGTVLFRAVSPGVLGTLLSLFRRADDDPSVQGRTEDYDIVFPMIYRDLLTGRGAGTFMPERYILLDNQYLNTLVSTGIIGIIGFVGLFLGGMGVARGIRRRAKLDEDRHLAQALFASILACMVTSFTFDSLSFAQFSAVLSVLLGMVGALWRLSNVKLGDPAVRVRAEGGRVMPPLLPDLPWQP